MRSRIALFWLLAALAACSDDVSKPRVCVPGEQVACPCLSNEESVQICKEDGSGFGSCSCGAGGSGGSGGSGGRAGSGGGGSSGGKLKQKGEECSDPGDMCAEGYQCVGDDVRFCL